MKEKLAVEEFLNQKKIYFVGSPEDDTVLIAMNPSYNEQRKTIRWWDTVKERIKQIESISVDEQRMLQFTDTEGILYLFAPLTLPFYNRVVKKQLLVKREFSSEEEMIAAFEETINK